MKKMNNSAGLASGDNQTTPITNGLGARSAKPSDEGSWVWQSRHAIEVLTDVALETNQAAAARSVYLAITQCSRDGSPVVATTRSVICSLAGVRYTTLDAANKILVRSGVVDISRVRVNGLDTGLRYRLLSVPVKRVPVPVDTTDMSEEEYKKGMIRKEEMTLPSCPGRVERASAPKKPKVGTIRNPRPLPNVLGDVIVFGGSVRVSDERATAFFHYQNENGWKVNGRPMVDWQKALLAWVETDRHRVVNRDDMDNEKFHAMIEEEGFSKETVNDWIALMRKKDWRIRNPFTGRMEPVRDYRAALKSFVASELSQTLEEKGIR